MSESTPQTEQNAAPATPPASAATNPPAEPSPAASQSGTTTIAKKWSIKMYIITLAMLVLGIWGTVDAIVVYPKRGARAAEYYEFQHLQELKSGGRLANDLATVGDPAAKLAELQTKARDGGAGSVSGGERAKLDWLTQLKLIGQLDPKNTAYPRTDFRKEAGQPVDVGSADERLASLTTKFVTPDGAVKPPSPLSWYDIPSQWIIAAVGFGVFAWLMMLILKVRSKSYSWDAPTKTLTLPGGDKITPSDIAEFDKSKWDKLYIKLVVKPGHATLGGKSLELDLLRYVPLEERVLEMERVGKV
jgi:hypothetical protein